MAVNSINNSKAKCSEAEEPTMTCTKGRTHPKLSLQHMARDKGN